jgi:hypothetical protein
VSARHGTALAVALLALATSASGQSLEQRVLGVRNGDVRLSYATRPGICGNGDQGISMHGREDKDGWQSNCDEGPARLTLSVADGEVVDITARVGGSWKPRSGVTDLGTVPAREAATMLLAIARRKGRGADEAIFPAMMADSMPGLWRELVTLARTPTVRRDVRKSAVFWLGQEAADAATKDLKALVGDEAIESEVRESAVFALSQRPADQAVPALMEVARTSRDPRLRRSAIFWLGQTDDPRALAYFEDVLTHP